MYNSRYFCDRKFSPRYYDGYVTILQLRSESLVSEQNGDFSKQKIYNLYLDFKIEARRCRVEHDVVFL